jgi:hypothetical protein
LLVHIKFLQCTASEEKTRSVGSSPVGETIVDSVALEFVGIGGTEDFVAGKLGSDKLADDVSVGESNDEAVLGRVVFVLGLRDKALAGVVVGLACSSALVLGLEAALKEGSAVWQVIS